MTEAHPSAPANPAWWPRAAVVTGADTELGRAVVVALAGGGVDVGLAYHADEAGAKTTAAHAADEFGVNTAVRHLDLGDLPTGAAAVDELADELDGVDILVTTPAAASAEPMMELDFDTWCRVRAANLDGAFLCDQRAARRMIAGGGGRIINVTGVQEHAPRAGAAPLCAAQAGVGMLGRVLAAELAEHRITVNSVAPGGVSGHATEIAAVVAFLATPAAGHVTGASYVVDGGELLGGGTR